MNKEYIDTSKHFHTFGNSEGITPKHMHFKYTGIELRTQKQIDKNQNKNQIQNKGKKKKNKKSANKGMYLIHIIKY